MQWVHIFSNIWEYWISEFLLIKFVLFPLLNLEGRAMVYLLLDPRCLPPPIKLTIKLTTKQALFKVCSLFNRVRFLRNEIKKNALRGHHEEQKDK